MKDRTAAREAEARYRAKNRDKLRAKALERARRNPEKHNANTKKWRAVNRERCNEQANEWRKANPEAWKAIAKKSGAKYRAAHPEVGSAALHRYRARKKSATPLTVVRKDELEFLATKRIVSLLLGIDVKDLEWGHIKPLSRGGTHEPSNWQWQPREVNRNQSDKLISELDVGSVAYNWYNAGATLGKFLYPH